MSKSWTFGRKIGAGFVVAGAILLVIAVAGYRNTHRLIEGERWVAHTHEVRRQAADLLSLMKDAETGQRGYILIGEDSYLEPYRSAVGAIDERYRSLHELVADNPAQQRRLEAIRPIVDRRLDVLKRNIDIRESHGLEDTIRSIAGGEGKEVMDQLRRAVAEFDAEEATLLDRRSTEARRSAEATKAIILWGSLAGFVFVLATGFLISRSLGRQIGTAVQHVQSASAELQSAANQQATGAREQASAMSEITTTISELLATSRQIADSARRVAQIAGETAAGARTGDGIVERGHESVAGIRKQVDVIVNHMLELGRKSQEVGSVLEIVSELAEQTNILAINATIEAAGAGEAGKRFAVVADEIRKLADRVANSTKEIRVLIDDVRSAVNATVMTTEAGSKAVDLGARQFAEVASSFEQIASLVRTTTEAAAEIELSTRQQSSAVEQVNAAVTSVAQGTRETEASTGQTLQTASQLAGLSKELLQLVRSEGSA